MQLITRYIEAVQRNLSKSMRNEVGEELSSIIHSTKEEKEEGLSRELNHQEVVALLNQHGHPEKIAANYGSTDVLIGDQWFPVYKKILVFVHHI